MELLFYPAILEALDNGAAAADEAIHEHVEIEETRNQLDGMRAEDDGFDAQMQELMAEVRHHVEEQEAEIFPAFRASVDADELQRLGKRLERAKSMVPTRPHPNAPTGPVGKLAASPPAALIDRVRDTLRSMAE